MPKSMTAFAQGEQKDALGTLRCEMRAVNHRYLDIGLQLPDALKNLELPVRDLIRNRMQRGKVTLSLSFEPAQLEQAQISIDEATAQAYILSCEKIAAAMTHPSQVSPLDILRCPGVVRSGQTTPVDLEPEAMMLLNKVLDSFLENRSREGEALKLVLLERIDAIAAQVEQVEKVVPEIRAALEQRLRKRLVDLDIDTNPERLEQELVVQAQRMDVDEEIDRLRTHLKEVRLQLDMDEPVGRRLDFLAQELNREANTLASKSQGVAQTQAAVEIKVCIEQIREQIQNIE